MTKFNFRFVELTRSRVAKLHGIDNVPTGTEYINLANLVQFVLQPMRDKHGAPLLVNSGYRCPEVNKIVGGAQNSQHMLGEAADITTGTVSKNIVLFEWASKNIPFDQIILEHSGRWIHVSYKTTGENRHQVLRT